MRSYCHKWIALTKSKTTLLWLCCANTISGRSFMCSVAAVGGAVLTEKSDSGRSKIVFHNCNSRTKHKFRECSPKFERKLSPPPLGPLPRSHTLHPHGARQYTISNYCRRPTLVHSRSHTPTHFMEWYVLMQECSNICSYNFVCEVECALMQICGPKATEETAHRSTSTNDVRIAHRELETIFLPGSSNPLW